MKPLKFIFIISGLYLCLNFIFSLSLLYDGRFEFDSSKITLFERCIRVIIQCAVVIIFLWTEKKFKPIKFKFLIFIVTILITNYIVITFYFK